MAKRTIAAKNEDAEARAVETGHRAWVQADGSIKVASDSFAQKSYAVTFVAHLDGLVSFTCTPQGRNAFREDHLYAESGAPGVAPCWHAALAARRLCREGLAEYDAEGRWCVTAKARALQPSASTEAQKHAPARERDKDGVVHLVCQCGWRVNYAGTEQGAQRSMNEHVEARREKSGHELLEGMGLR